jgi:hypothetical protein
MRALEARVWRNARAQYWACDPATRAIIRHAWNTWRGPLTAPYFISVVERENGVAERRSQHHREKDRALRRELQAEADRQSEMPL